MTAELELHRGGRSAALPEKLEYARFLAASGLLPAQYREKPANILYATEYGEMLGLAPMAAINGIHVIEGKPSASAALISALVRRAGHRLRVTGDDERAVCEIVRADDPEFTFRAEWTIQRARNAGLANKGVWKSYPAAMLKARALTECARDACQEALSGLQYTPEELGAQVDEEGAPVRAVAVQDRPADPGWASKTATPYEREHGVPEPAARGQAEEPPAAPADEPDWDALVAEVARTGVVTAAWKLAREHRPGDMALRERIQAAARSPRPAPHSVTPADDVVDAEVVDEPQPVTQAQHKHMHALWNSGGISDREERLAITGVLIGRTVASSSDLTAAEADRVIARLREHDKGTGVLYQQMSRWLDEAAAAFEDTEPPS